MFGFAIISLCLSAQEKMVKIGTSLDYGSTFTFSVEPTEGDSIIVDFGDGKKVKKGTKTWWGTNSDVEGKLLGDTVRIYGAINTLDVPEQQITSIAFYGEQTLTRLNAQKNLLTYEGTDLTGLDNLKSLDLSDNTIVMLNLMAMEKLESFTINRNPELSTVVFADNNSLVSVNMDDCDIVHFYEKSMPELNYLSIQNGSLMDLTIGDFYPKLNSLEISGNIEISEIDVTGCPELDVLRISNTKISELNLVNNKKLRSLSVDHTPMTKLAIDNNTNIQDLNVSNTAIKKLDVSKLGMLRNITIDSTEIARLDLTGKLYLANVSAKNTAIEFLDMHDQIGYNGLKRLDLRDNKRMTPQTLNFTFAAMPPHMSESRWTNVYIDGIPGVETSDTELITGEEYQYRTDVQGDGSAPMEPVALTVEQAAEGSVELTQMGEDLKTWTAVGEKVKPGYPISVKQVPAEGFKLAGMEVNGQLVEDTIFVVSATATVRPVFVKATEPTITLTVPSGAVQQYFLAADEDGTEITVDWGDGEPQPYVIGKTVKAVVNDNGTTGTKVIVKGNVTYADFSSYSGFGVDNMITAIDISDNGKLRTLKTYMNAISTLDVSNQPDLEFLDCAYSELESLDVTNNPKLTDLIAYGNYIEDLNLSNQKDLVNIDLKNNALSEMNLGACDKVEKLILQGNYFNTVDVTGMPRLKTLNVSSNSLTSLDLSNNSELEELSAYGNKLTELELSNNTKLRTLLVQSNNLTGLDLSNQTELSLIYVGNNGWDACTLNDFYYSLNEWKEVQSSGYGTTNTLWVNESGSANDNDASHAESDIARAKGWKLDVEGDGTGCDLAYVTIIPTSNGEVKLYNEDNSEVKSGDKVMKNSVIRMEAIPAEGYKAAAAKANGKLIVDNKFTVTKATDVLVQFTISTSIDGVTDATVTVESGDHELVFTTDSPTTAEIYTPGGKQIFKGEVSGRYAVSVREGVYVVKIGSDTKKILVR